MIHTTFKLQEYQTVAECLDVVQDNLNTHKHGSFQQHLPLSHARLLSRRLVLHTPDQNERLLKIRSMVGLIPLFAVEILDETTRIFRGCTCSTNISTATWGRAWVPTTKPAGRA